MERTENITLFGTKALEMLFDNGNYTEIGAHVTRGHGSEEYEGVVTAYGPMSGRLVFAFAQDSDRMKGAFDSRTAKKIENLYELALKSGAPVVGVFASSGSVITEGSSLLGGLSSFLTAVAAASGNIPQVALVSGVCTGCMATAASMFDFSVAIEGAEFSAGAGSATEGKGIKPSVCASTEREAVASVRAIVSAIPDNCDRGPAIADETDLNRDTGLSTEEAKDPDKLISALSDDGSFVEIGDRNDRMITGFAPIAGRYIGLVAASGDITAEGAEKAASFVGFCSDYSIPVLTLIDSNGFDICPEAEAAGLGRASAKLAMAYRNAGSPRISAVIGNACGASLPIMGSRKGAADISFALDSAVISPLSPERSVAFLMNDMVSKDKTREDLEAEFAAGEASAVNAAFDGDLDFVVSIDELRRRICGALFMLDRE